MGGAKSEQWIADYQNAGCSMFRMEASEALDYPGRSDLLVGYTVVPELWKRAHNGEEFRIASLARHGETFCYVKIDGIDGLGSSSFADREEIEDALDEALADSRIGCVIGAGTGRRYSYVDFVINDLARGYDIIRRVLRKGRIPKRSWVLRFDAILDDAPSGIWEDSPAPPS